MSYVVLARKYRPQTLDDVVGQEHIVTMLKNAIRENRIAQSFLFVGSRGVGKTSTARILAKILNCQNRKGPENSEPCNKCDSCVEITNGNSLYVLEIDGASNRGIDEIRNLRENVKFKPAAGTFKVYIIDEVHMLTQEAFNALLKTLEEPPPHVKFIFATTEPHRVLATIISRCQRYDFRRIPSKTIAESLSTIAKKEKITIDEAALFTIAKTAEGGMRDAQSILDQIANYAEGKITLDVVEEVLGFTNEKTYLDLAGYIAERDSQQALTVIQRVVSEGKDLRDFNKGLLEVLRDIMLIKTTNAARTLIDRLEGSITALTACADLFTVEDILYCLTVLQNLVGQLRYSTFPQINTEVAIIKMTRRADMVALRELLDAVNGERGMTAKPVTQKKNDRSRPASIPASPTPSTGISQKNAERIQAKIQSYLKEETPASPLPAAEAKKKAPERTEPYCTFKEIEEKWQSIILEVRQGRMSTGTFLSEAEPLDVEDDTVVLALPSEFKFHKEALQAKDNIDLVEKALYQITGAKMRVSYVVTEKEGTEAVIKEQEQREKHSKIIESATQIFQGRTVRRK
jgi:DNA polymerase-3 subunit gamma/tau